MEHKEFTVQVKVTRTMLDRIEAEAEKHTINPSQYVREAIDFYSTFDLHFLEHIATVANKVKLPLPTVIQQLLVAYVATDTAKMNIFKTDSKTYQRAFQYDMDGLIEGDRHSDLVQKQVTEEINTLIEKPENATKTKKPRNDAALMAARL